MPVAPGPTAAYASPLADALIRHSFFDAAEDALLESLADPEGAPIPFLIGSPGFGKSRLIQVVANQIAWDHREQMERDPNLRPVVGFEALAPHRGNFDLRLGFLRILDDLGEVGVEYRIGRPLDPGAALERMALHPRMRDVAQLQLDVIDGLIAHGTRVVVIDEINHFAYVNDVARYQATLDILKSITNETGSRIVCAGSYDAMGFRIVSGQLIRRQRELHLRRYRADVKAEYAEYARVVAEMLELIGFDGDASVLVPTLYRASVGTVGTTRDVLVQADHAAHWHGETLVHGLARTLRPDAATREMARQIVEGEKPFEASVRADLDALIGLSNAAPILAKAGRTGASKKPKPGRRPPTRDAAGALADGR